MRIQAIPAADNSVRLEVNGMINLQGFFQVEEAILKIMKKNCFKLELEMSGVKHMDYRGVEILVKRAERLRSYGGDLILHGLSPYLVNILQMAGAGEAFEIASTREPVQCDLFRRQERKPLTAVA
ncbi:MAG: STAS domain-containing protein [bacterium]|nr:STAS domain-containing protein [bacterium]